MEEKEEAGEDAGEVLEFECAECARKEYRCMICNVAGPYGIENNPSSVFKCKLATCRRFYHRACLQTYMEDNEEDGINRA